MNDGTHDDDGTASVRRSRRRMQPRPLDGAAPELAAGATGSFRGTHGHTLRMLSHADVLRLGFSRPAADAIFRALPVFKAPGTNGLRVLESDVAAYVRKHTSRPGTIR